ncbi:hypothetical protein G6K97_30550 [Agrobacterium rhizogenes]|uniref:hypothetical protein n=1 Tax=Rhizobium rhizogenes TaxID=359 RepID=UPI001572343B|nr:hypothetical protein [Rhizobium rhizogenes]NTH81488.1 hypothetical protein [Rhizobium rhizogenes]NTH87492.1 hypothetical protein [Rhizobium rhizogenes]
MRRNIVGKLIGERKVAAITHFKIRLFAVAIFWFLNGSCEVVAQTEPPRCVNPTKQEDWSRSSHLDQSRPFSVHLGPLRFAVPWKYLSPRPPQILQSCTMEREAFGVQFWIPDGHAPERNLSWQPEFSPPETSRLLDPDASIIKVESIRYYETSAPDDYYSPDARVRNLLRLYGGQASLSGEGDLTMIKSREYPEQPGDWFRQSRDDSVFITCLGIADRSVCKGFIDLKDKHLSIFFLSNFRALRHNALIISTLRNLLQQWENTH